MKVNLGGSRRHDAPRIHILFTNDSERQIQGMELPHFGTIPDTPYWTFHPSRKFDYFFLSAQQEIHSTNPRFLSTFFRTMGFDIMPKWKFFIWKLWHNGIALNTNLYCQGSQFASRGMLITFFEFDFWLMWLASSFKLITITPHSAIVWSPRFSFWGMKMGSMAPAY